MRFLNRSFEVALLTVAAASIFSYLSNRSRAETLPVAQTAAEQALKGFAQVKPIDVHTHVFKTDQTFQAFLNRMHLTVLDILVVDDTAAYAKQLEPQHTDALAVVRASRGRVAFCTTFDPYKFANPDFAAQAIRQVNGDFAQGAVALKIWKNLGMEIKRADGTFLMPDDSILEPIYKDIAEHRRTVLAHLAEPDACWQSPNASGQGYLNILRRYVSPYYTQNPQWYMYMHPDHPSKQAILAARDHLLEINPHLRLVGAHLGSMENDVNEIAERLDKYPNFAVELGGRGFYFMMQPRQKVQAFLIKYQDRILYGTDLQIRVPADIKATLRGWETTYAQDWRFFATDETFQVEGQQVRGLKLPPIVLNKIFHQNAVDWFPGISTTQ